MPRRPLRNIPETAAGHLHILRQSKFTDSATAFLFDHFVGDREHPWGNGEAERLCGLKIDDQIEFGRLQHREVAGLFSLEDSSGVNAGLAVGIGQVRAVAN